MQEDFFNKIYLPLTLLQGFKKVIQGLCVRGCWRLNRNCNILTPTFMAISVVSFSFSRVAQPEAQGPLCWIICYILSATSLDPNSSGPQGPFGLMWLSLPHLVYNSDSNSTVLTSVLTELYNGSTPTQSPTRSLESHVGSSSSGNNCPAV